MNTQSELTTLRAQLTASEASRKELREALETVQRYLAVGNATSAYNYTFVVLANDAEKKSALPHPMPDTQADDAVVGPFDSPEALVEALKADTQAEGDS